MLSSRQVARAQKILIVAGAILAFYYFFAFRPLSRRAAALDAPLGDAWKKLATAKVGSSSDEGIDLAALDKDLREVQASVKVLQKVQPQVEAAVALDQSVRDKMREPFQLVDFQIEELLRIEELGRAAQQQKVTISPSVFSNFPEYRADRDKPELLWGQLAFLHQVLSTAIRCNVTAIQNIQLPSYVEHKLSTNASAFLFEVPIQIQLVGSMDSLSKVLASLPSRAEGLKTAKLPEGSGDKPSLFIDRIILTKVSPENPDSAHLDLRVCGFVYRE